METRKETLSSRKVCRFCLATGETLLPLYDNKVRAPKNSVPFALKILACIAIEIFPSDHMPQYICQRCKLFMELSYAFKQLCRQADEAILQFIQNGSPLTPMSWPTQLTRVYKATHKSEVNVVKTAGGATVKVEEVSDSEEGEEDNVYNVKIGDGSEEGKSIKIIASVDAIPKGRQGISKKFASVAKLTRHVREHAGEKPYPCKHCDKSFTKSHHYTRHLRVKHTDRTRTPGPYNESDAYRCDECEETFATQDDLMYHSALHATTNLICPLCQEKFDDVDSVTTHIKSHTDSTEFMCDYCELIFTSKEKLDAHVANKHEDEILAIDQEMENDESSMDMDAEEDDEDNSINVKEENGEMVVEIKKAGGFMLQNIQTEEDKIDNTQSEDSDMQYADSPGTELESMPTQTSKQPDVTRIAATLVKTPDVAPKVPPAVTKPAELIPVKPAANPSPILRKAEDIKRKVTIALTQQSAPVAEKNEKPKVETSTTSTGANDKSLRLLEKELQDLKRTNSRSEVKTPAKPIEPLRSRRPQLVTSTPKNRNADKKETAMPKATQEKTPIAEKKLPERKAKEPKESKSNNNSIKEDRELKGNKEEKESKGNKEEKEVKGIREEKESKSNKEEKESRPHKEEKETRSNSKEDKVKEEKKENSKNIVKNGGETPAAPSEDSVRRSARPSKVKDYAKMISSVNSDEDDTGEEEDSEEFKEPEKTPDTSRGRSRRSSSKATSAPAPFKPAPAAGKADTPAPAARKRGRPRKEPPRSEVPSKIKKDEPSEEEAEPETAKAASLPKDDTPKENQPDNIADGAKTPEANKTSEPRPGVIISPSGQTLKKVPIKALPPGVKALPLPGNSSRLGGGEVTEMQIGKKIVKVQKIVMTKAEVEAMTKKGLLEIKDGTMVLKQGIKLPSADPSALKSSLVGEGDQNKESQSKPTPTRCELEP